MRAAGDTGTPLAYSHSVGKKPFRQDSKPSQNRTKGKETGGWSALLENSYNDVQWNPFSVHLYLQPVQSLSWE